MRRIVLSFALTIALAFLLTLSTVPAFAATFSAHHITRANAPAVGACYTSPSAGNCDGQDPYAEGCNAISYHQGGDVWYLAVYWATNVNPPPAECNSNWGVAWAPNSEYTQMVWLETQDGRVLYYCTSAAIQSSACHEISKDGQLKQVIPNGYQSWHTDMLWAPDTSTRICEIWSPNVGSMSGSNSGCSNWH